MTLQQIAEKRPRKIDLNLLPPEYLPAKKSKLSLILALVTVILVCALVPLIIAKAGVDSDIKPMRVEITDLDATIQANTAQNRQAAVIQSMIDNNNSKMAVIESSYTTVVGTRVLWSKVISEINDLTPYSKINLSSISLPSGTCVLPSGTCPSGSAPIITLAGTSAKQQYVLDYATALQGSPLFKNVDFSFGASGVGTAVRFTLTAPLDLLNIITKSSK